MKPTDASKETGKDNFEEELEAEAKHTSSKENAEGVEWGDAVRGIDVGNVIRDVLITLRDHPEIVRKLIAEEERSLAEKVLSSQSDSDNLILPSDFQLPSPQLKQAPKRVVKKMGSNHYEMKKRQKETPEETIDMTYPEEGGASKTTENDIQEGGSNEIKDLLKTDKVAHLVEGGSNKPMHTDLKRSKESDAADGDSISESDEKGEMSKANYWKTYKDRKHKNDKGKYWKMFGQQMDEEKVKGQENEESNEESLTKGQYWKNHGKNKDSQNSDKLSKAEFWKNHGKNKDSHSSEEVSKGKYWKNHGKNKDRHDSNELSKAEFWKNHRLNKSKEVKENKTSEEVDSPELEDSDKTDSSENISQHSDENENDLYQLTKQKKSGIVM